MKDLAIWGCRGRAGASCTETSCRRVGCHRGWLAAWVGAVVLLTACPALVADDTPQERQAAAWNAFYAGRFDQTVKLCEPLLTAQNKHDRCCAAHCQARAFWAKGDQAGRDKARQLWKQLGKVYNSYGGGSLDPATDAVGRRVLIGQALADEAGGKSADAIGALSGFFKLARHSDPAVAEGMIELARLLGEAKRFDEADKALLFAEGYLKHQLGPGGELNKTLIGPFAAELPRARQRLAALKEEVLFPGKGLFAQAERLRRGRQYAEAVKLYQQVVAKFPGTACAEQSSYCIGLCAVGLQRFDDAVKVWERFVAAKPAGAFRGQAAVGLMDLHLEEFLNLEAAEACGKRALASLQTALATAAISELDKQIKASWESAAADLYLRLGLIALLKNDHLAAGDAFGKARTAAAANKLESMAAGLEVLVESAKTKAPLLPADAEARGGGLSGKTALALAMVRIFDLTARRPRAEALVDGVLAGKWADRTAAQLAYALFLKGRMVQSRGLTAAWSPPAKPGADKPTPLSARDLYTHSIKTFDKGSWQDETLYCLADLVEQDARRQFGPRPASIPKTDKAGGNATVPLKTRAQIQQETRARREAELKWLEARAGSLPYWKELIERFPKSPLAEDAMFRAGLLLADLEEWKEAVAALEGAVKAYPDSPFTGQAYVRLIDIHLAEFYAIASARQCATAAVAWAARVRSKTGGAEVEVPATGLRVRRAAPTADTLARLKYDVYLRAGLVAYLEDKGAEAGRLFELARPLAPRRDCRVIEGRVPTGIERLIERAKQGPPLTPKDALAGSEQAGLVLRLADVYQEGGEATRARWLYERVIERKVPGASEAQRSWATFMRGRGFYAYDQEPQAALEDYEAALKMTPKASWADRAIFLSGNIQFNHLGKPDEAISLWRKLLAEYPASAEAQRAAYYVGVAYQWTGRPALARRAFDESLKRWPGGTFSKLSRRHLAAMDAAGRGTSRDGDPKGEQR